MSLAVENRPRGVRFRVKVQARARQEQIAVAHDGLLRLRVTAPPLQGRANEAVVALLAERLRLPKSSIKIIGGERAPLKTIEVTGLDANALSERLRLAPTRRRAGAGGSE